MGNCFLTKLVGSVNNDNLLKLGEIQGEMYGEGNVTLYSSEQITIKDLTGTFVTPSGESVVIGNPVAVRGADGHKLSIVSKHTITKFQGGNTLTLNLKDCMYNPSVVEITARLMGDLSDIVQRDSLTIFSGQKGELYGDISNIAKFPALTQLIFSGNSGEITGNISSLGGLTSLAHLGLGDCPWITGTIEDFVAGQRTAGRTSGSITCYYLHHTQITFNGSALPTAATATLSWTATTITYNGVTITA